MSQTASDRALALMAALVLDEAGTLWGDVATDWQWDDAKAFLSDEGPRNTYLCRPRGGSKTTDVAGMALAALVEQLPVASRAYAVAATQAQAGLLLTALSNFVRRTPALQAVLKVKATEIVNSVTGSTLLALAADGPGAWGLLPSLIVADELAQWPQTPSAQEVWTAVLSTLPKVPGSRLVCLTTAGDPGHWAYKVFQHAETSPEWRVSLRVGAADWQDPVKVAEMRRMLTPSQFARLYEGRWTAPEDSAFDIDDLRACQVLDGPLKPKPSTSYWIGVDLGLTNDKTVVIVAHREPVTSLDPDDVDPESSYRIVVDRVLSWQGSKEAKVSLETVGRTISEMSREYHQAKVIGDPYAFAQMAEQLRNRGVEVEEFTFSPASVVRISMVLVRIVRDRLLMLPKFPPDLVDELARVRLRENAPGQYRMDHHQGGHDDHAMALAMATYALVTEQSRSAYWYLSQLCNEQATCICGQVNQPGSWWCLCGLPLATPRVAV